MFCNKRMKKLLKKCGRKKVVIEKKNLIVKRETIHKEDYYCFKKFCYQYDENLDLSGEALTEYEWDGNEFFISGFNSAKELLRYSLKIIRRMKKQMKRKFPGEPFDIVLSMDLQRKKRYSSATVRFYKVRENTHIISEKEIHLWKQPILVLSVH